jgi:hypothetical protein
MERAPSSMQAQLTAPRGKYKYGGATSADRPRFIRDFPSPTSIGNTGHARLRRAAVRNQEMERI